MRTRPDDGLCSLTGAWSCISSTTRFVWPGDHLLWELKTTEGDAPVDAGGVVSYTHAGGIDRPLVITKGVVSIVTHQNWRGQFARGTYGVNSGRAAGVRSDCAEYPAQGCTPIPWPGERTTPRHELTEPEGQIQNWWGGLVDGMRDASGLMYMRNRYYDPQSGQFTQPDPVGLAGGLNAYGFAAGDPVSYSDPYGLCPAYLVDSKTLLCPGGLTHTQYDQLEDAITLGLQPAGALPLLSMLENGRIVSSQQLEGTENRAQVVHPFAAPDTIRIGPAFWGYSLVEMSWMISHEYGHVLQRLISGLVYFDRRLSVRGWFELTARAKDGSTGSMYAKLQQYDANMFSCSVVVDASSFSQRYCR